MKGGTRAAHAAAQGAARQPSRLLGAWLFLQAFGSLLPPAGASSAPVLSQDPASRPPVTATGGSGTPQEGAPEQGPSAVPAAPVVRRITVEGAQRYTESQLISALGQALGAPLDEAVVDNGLRTLWSSFHVRAEVRRRQLAPASLGATPEIELLLVVVEMTSDRKPRFVGNADIDEDTLRKWALLEDKVELFEYQANRVRQRLLEGYRREGYAWVEVECHSRASSATAGADPQAGAAAAPGLQSGLQSALLSASMTDVVFEIREGPQVRVKAYEIVGNRSMPERGVLFWREGLEIFSDLQLTAPWAFHWWGSAFVQETLDADVQSIRNVYRERGWLEARVTSELAWNADRSEVRIRILIDEGEPYVVDQVAIEFLEFVRQNGDWTLKPLAAGPGQPRFEAAQLLEKCELKPGMRYEDIKVLRDRQLIGEFYGEKGHLSHDSLPPDVRFEFLREPDLFTNPREHKLRVTYRIVEGRPLTLREISFAGASHTRDEVLRREVSVFPGGKADQKEISRSRSRIEGTGFFSDQITPENHQDPTYRFLEVPGSKDLIDLEFQVQEGRVVDFNIAGGIDSNEGVFGLISLSLRNFDLMDAPSKWTRTLSEMFRKEAFHGGGQRIDLELSPGTRVSRARLHFNDPDIFSRYVEPISFDLDLQRSVRIWRTHDEDRFRKEIKFGRRFGFDTFASVGLVHTDLELLGINTQSPPTAVVRQERLGETVLAGISLDASTRDLDNLISPHQGWKASLRNVALTEGLGSDFEYLRSEVGLDGYLPTGTKDDGTVHVLHLELDAGVMLPYGDTDEVPYTERYFLGGSSTLRGFAQRGAGDRATDLLGNPTSFAEGGESYFSGTLEWLYPLYSQVVPGSYKAVEALRGALFLDLGALGDSAGNLDLERTRASLGFGIGLARPLPIQLNFGFPVRRFAGDERQTFTFSIGLTF